jgi:hypothetical protein
MLLSRIKKFLPDRLTASCGMVLQWPLLGKTSVAPPDEIYPGKDLKNPPENTGRFLRITWKCEAEGKRTKPNRKDRIIPPAGNMRSI